MRLSIARTVLAAAFLAAAMGTRAAAQTRWSRYDEAATVLARRDTSLFLDTVRLERIRSGIERSRAAFPELRRIVDIDFGAVTYYINVLMLPDSVQDALGEQVRLAVRRGARRDSARIEIASTGIATFDSLNAAFHVVRITAPLSERADTLDRSDFLVIELARPANIRRIDEIYRAHGIESGLAGRSQTWFYPVVNWRPGEAADELDFRLASDCRDPCHRHEHYVIRVPRNGGPVQMIQREVKIDPD
jgi:hypothetical protein